MTEVPSPYRALTDIAAEKAETASAAQVIQALVKAERGFAIYLPNNPLHEKFFEEFGRRVLEHLDQFGPLSLDFSPDSILFLGEAVYTSEDRRESLALRVFADGIRNLVIDKGVEPRELRALVEALRQAGSDNGEDDVATRLWSSDLVHVRYSIADMPAAVGTVALVPGAGGVGMGGAGSGGGGLGVGGAGSGGGGLGGAGDAAGGAPGGGAAPGAGLTHEERIRRYAAELAESPHAPVAVPLPQHVFTLEEHEIASLQEQVAAEQGRVPLEDVAGILEAVIGAETEMSVLEEFIEIVVRLCGDLMLTGHIDYAVRVLGMLPRIAARPGLPQERVAALEAARGRLMTPEVVEGLTRQLAAGDAVDRGDLRALVTTLGSAAVEPFCRILGDVSAKETRKALIEALAETGKGSPDLFLPFLSDPRWYLVRNTIYILRRIGSPEAARAVRRCAGNKDPRVRKEVLLYLEETGDPAGEPLLLTFLADGVSSLRIAAARGLARRGTGAAADRLLAVATAESFAARDRVEREAVWEAIADLAPERALPPLRDLLLKRRWFGQARELEDTACAVAGLRRIGTPAALELLRQAAATKRGRALELVEKALRSSPTAGGRARSAQEPDGSARG